VYAVHECICVWLCMHMYIVCVCACVTMVFIGGQVFMKEFLGCY